FFQAEDGIRARNVTGVQTCALPILLPVVQPDPRAARLERALRQKVRGEVRFDAHSRLLYSTDASLYQFLPVGVVVPEDASDVVEIGRASCREREEEAVGREILEEER